MLKRIYILRRKKDFGDVAVMTLKFILDEYIEKCWNKVVWRAFAIVMNLWLT